jgi:TPR repeat protein
MWMNAVRRALPKRGSLTAGSIRVWHSVLHQQPCHTGIGIGIGMALIVQPLPFSLLSSSSLAYSTSRSTSSSAAAVTASASSKEDNWQAYQEACERYQSWQKEQEEEKSQAMFQAWQKATQVEISSSNVDSTTSATKKPKKNAGGIAVVQTLARQTQRALEKEETHEKSLLQACRDALQKAALEEHHPEALMRYAQSLLDDAVNFDASHESFTNTTRVQEAIECLHRAGEKGLSDAYYLLSQLYWGGFPSIESNMNLDSSSNIGSYLLVSPNHKEAVKLLEKAIAMANTDALYFYGVHKLNSENDNADTKSSEPDIPTLKEGLRLIHKAADSGHAEARHYLALFYLNGNDVLGIPGTDEKFVDQLDQAAKLGNPEALLLRGSCLYHGEHGYNQSYVEAFYDFERAAQAGNADAAVSAGAMLYKGTYPGVPHDLEVAFQYYQLGGELGNVEGWRNVVACYLAGDGVPKSEEMAKYIAKVMLKEEVTT